MIKSKKRTILTIYIISLFSILISCNKNSNEDSNEIKNKIDIEYGTIVKEENGKYLNYKLNKDIYEKLKNERVIFEYNKSSGNYLFRQDNKNMIYYNGNDIEIKDENISDIKLSSNGNYLSYFNNKENLNSLIVKRLSDDSTLDIKSKVSISGNLVDWLNDDTLIFYGVDNNKNNGIFTYNITEQKEKLIYKLNKGYIEFLEVTGNGVIIFQNLGNEKILKKIEEDEKVININSNINRIKDIQVTKEGTFLLGDVNAEGPSIYKLENKDLKKIVYDFPHIINMEKDLSYTVNGNLLFSGSTKNNKKNKIYIYENDYVKTINMEESEYNFVHIN